MFELICNISFMESEFVETSWISLAKFESEDLKPIACRRNYSKGHQGFPWSSGVSMGL